MKVVYIDIDSLRSDHLGCYGYPRPTSPVIDGLAEQGIVFENCFISDSPCMPSRAATFSGRYGIKNGVVTHGPLGERLVGCTTDLARMRVGAPMLQEYLSARGVETASISPFGRHPSPWFYRGWNTFIDPDPTVWFQQVLAPRINQLAFDWLDSHASQDFFLHLNYWDPHLPYNQPIEYALKFMGMPNRPGLPTDDEIREHSRSDAIFSPWWFGINDQADLDRYVSSFDGEINYVDEHLGVLINRLRELKIYDDCVVIVSADHGEQFGEWGIYVDHCTASDATNRVPLIVHAPSLWPKPQRIDELVLNLDLAPTLCDLFGLPVPLQWDGASLSTLLKGGSGPRRSHVVLGHGLYTAQRVVRDHDWKYVRTYHSGEWKFEPEALYRVSEDVSERHDVSADNPEILRRMRALLFRFEHQRQYLDAACQLQDMATDGSLLPVDPLLQVAQLGPAAYNSGKARLPDWSDWEGLLKSQHVEERSLASRAN